MYEWRFALGEKVKSGVVGNYESKIKIVTLQPPGGVVMQVGDSGILSSTGTRPTAMPTVPSLCKVACPDVGSVMLLVDLDKEVSIATP